MKTTLTILALSLCPATAQQTVPLSDGQTATVTCACPLPAPPPAPSPYNSPSCGPSGGSTTWACGAWPTTTPPVLGAAGTITTDPDTGNRVLRVTQAGSFGEAASTAFKVFDGGWKAAWNASSTRIMLSTWGSNTNHVWALNFNPVTMSVNTPVLLPYQFTDLEWDGTDPDLVVGLMGGKATAYNVATKVFTTLFDPASTNWGGSPWLSGWGGSRVCIASAAQDTGYRLACYDRGTKTAQAIDLHAQTINGTPFTVYFQGKPVSLPASTGIHTITMATDGKWLAVDTHGNTLCSVSTLTNYASTSLFINLETGTGYEWNTACGGTHWAYGNGGMMMQSVSPKWTPTNNLGPCNSDSRGIARRTTDLTVDSGYILTQPCSFFKTATYGNNIHLSWLNAPGPVLFSALSDYGANDIMHGEIGAMQTDGAVGQGRLWRFAQHWNSAPSAGCGFMDYSSPSISRDGKWALFPSDWQGQTGTGGVCANGRRTDVFLFELR